MHSLREIECVNSWYYTTLQVRSGEQMEKDIIAQTKLAVKYKLEPGDSRYLKYVEEHQ